MTKRSQKPEVRIRTNRFMHHPCTRFYFNRAAKELMGVEKGYKAEIGFDNNPVIGVGLPDYAGKCITFQQNSKQKDVIYLYSIVAPKRFDIPSGTYEISEPFFKEDKPDMAFFNLNIKTK